MCVVYVKGRTKPLYIYLAFLGFFFLITLIWLLIFGSLSFKIFSRQSLQLRRSNEIELIDNVNVTEITQESYCVLG